jgi:amidase
VPVGKTNLGELALKSSGFNDYYGTPKNPFRHGFIPGGSSSGSAVAVADGTADVALGTDTAGSVRVPAACCGIAGLKTTFGLVPIKGVFPISPKHLDTVGPMAKDVSHLVQGMDLLQAGFSARYQAAVAAKPSGKNIKVGRLYLDGTDPAIDKAVDDALAAAGFHVIKLGQAFKAKWNKADKDGQTLALADAWVNDRKYVFKGGVERRTGEIILSGAVAENKYRDALKGQAQWKDALRRVFKKVDFIALPTLQTVPPRMPLFGGTVLFELRVLALQNTGPANLGGNPALAIPIPVKGQEVPVTSLQLVGRRLSEAELLNAGRLVESKP